MHFILNDFRIPEPPNGSGIRGVIMNTKRCSTIEKLFQKRDEILRELRKQTITIHTHDSWRDAIPESYSDMKELQSRITTSYS